MSEKEQPYKCRACGKTWVGNTAFHSAAHYSECAPAYAAARITVFTQEEAAKDMSPGVFT